MIATIGTFDGFHRGHQTLLARASERAAGMASEWGVITFRGLTAFKNFKYLFTVTEQEVLERYFSVPSVRRIDFTPSIVGMTPGEFLDSIGREFGVSGVVVGSEFRFGRDRAGDAHFLSVECPRRGWTVDIMPTKMSSDGVPINSTAVRASVAAGRMEQAADMLGYPYFCLGRVIHGDKRGRRLGVPTANLEINQERVEIRSGVYAVTVFHEGRWLAGGANIGVNPTFGVGERRFEVNIDGFSGDIYGRTLAVFLLSRIRDEIRFESAGDLKKQVTSDLSVIRERAGRDLESRADFWRMMAGTLRNIPSIQSS
ncbi:MAG: riboflavin biosynthesis protein RibF [Synergistaceae bacterium]|jgi:riboflavin kinase/FMN adenylyltransferase|nr:riboflavin biosynthesis protein RibF [Synergistaceae bacterium]